MNWQFHNKRQSLMVTNKHAGVGKLFDWSKKFDWSHVQYKIRGKSYKMSLTALPVKNTAVKKPTGRHNVPPIPRQIGLTLRLYCHGKIMNSWQISQAIWYQFSRKTRNNCKFYQTPCFYKTFIKSWFWNHTIWQSESL